MPELTVSLSPRAMAAVQQAVEHGEFPSESDVVADIMLAWAESRTSLDPDVKFPGTVKTLDELREKLREASDHPQSYVPMEEVFDELEARFSAGVQPRQ